MSYDKNQYQSYTLKRFGDFKVIRYKINNRRRSKKLKNVSNQKVRNAEEISNGGNYKKVFDYQWTMY